jgi:hypothetical protein
MVGETIIQTEQGLVERLSLHRGLGGSDNGVPDVRAAHTIDLKKRWIEGNGVEPMTTNRVLEIPEVGGEIVTHARQCLTKASRALIGREDLTQW